MGKRINDGWRGIVNINLIQIKNMIPGEGAAVGGGEHCQCFGGVYKNHVFASEKKKAEKEGVYSDNSLNSEEYEMRLIKQ